MLRLALATGSELGKNMEAPPACRVCGKSPAAACLGCRSVHYCSKDCQRAHWRGGHKGQCRGPGASAAPGAAAGLVAATVAQVEAFMESHPTGAFSALRGPTWRHWTSCAERIIALAADDRTKFALCLELCTAMKRTGPGLMPLCGMPCLSLLRGEMQRILEGHPSATPEQCAWLRQQTIELCRAIDLLTEERDEAWEDEAWLELRAQHLDSAPPGVRLLPWEAGTQIEWTSDSETWHRAEVVDRWYLQDLESKKQLMANLPLAKLRLCAA